MLVKVNKGTSQMTGSEQKYWTHMLSGDPMFKDFLQRQAYFGDDVQSTIGRQPICTRCERPCFHHEGGIACNHCGYIGLKEVTGKIYLQKGMYK